MPEIQALQIFLGVCEGVKALHEAKPEPLAHRDLKTANIICLSDSFEPIIVDMGSATEARVQICGQQDAQRLQELAEERCAIVYRAPELFSVQIYCMIGERTDIWSLGCVLYAICFFKCPFDVFFFFFFLLAVRLYIFNVLHELTVEHNDKYVDINV